jgi:hypothetical protein
LPAPARTARQHASPAALVSYWKYEASDFDTFARAALAAPWRNRADNAQE